MPLCNNSSPVSLRFPYAHLFCTIKRVETVHMWRNKGFPQTLFIFSVGSRPKPDGSLCRFRVSYSQQARKRMMRSCAAGVETPPGGAFQAQRRDPAQTWFQLLANHQQGLNQFQTDPDDGGDCRAAALAS